MTLCEFSIRRPVFAWMLMSGLIIFGAISLMRLGISQMPDVDFPVVEIRAVWEGAAPEIIESEIVDPIEKEVVQIEGLEKITSTIRQGAATIVLEFDINRDVDGALQEVQAAVSENRYPLGVDPPTLKKRNPEDEVIMWVGIAAPDRTLRDLIQLADRSLVNRFEIIPGVGEVFLGGYTQPSLRLWVDNEKLRQYQLTISDVVNAVSNEHIEVAAGIIENERQEFNLRTMGEEFTAEELSAVPILQRGSQPIYDTTLRIGDVAEVEDGLADIRRKAFITGTPGMGIGVKKQRGSNEVEVARSVRALVEDLKTEYPSLQFQINADFSRFVEESVSHTKMELLIAGFLTALVCYFFLGSLRSSINVILAIPTSVLGTFIILYFSGFTLNLFTLLALALAIGVVVDDAIMVLENIVRHFHMGKDRVLAARDGANQVFFAAIATTVVLVSIFLPVAFMDGVIGKFFFQFGITMSAAVMLSTVEALTLTPMRCASFMRRDDRPLWIHRIISTGLDHMRNVYTRLLRVPIRFPALTLLLAMATLPASWILYHKLPQEFVPPQDQGFFRIFVRTPVGSSLAYTETKIHQIQDWLRQQPDIQRWFINAGGNNNLANEGFAAVTAIDRSERPHISETMKRARKELGGIEDLIVRVPSMEIKGLSQGRTNPLAFNIRGADYSILQAKAQDITERLNQTGLVEGLDTDFRLNMPELRIIPDRAAAAARGVSIRNIGETIQAALGGVREGKFTNDGERYDVRIRLRSEQRLTPDSINTLQIRTSYGELIPLRDMVRTEVISTVQQVSRVNQQRAVSVFGNIAAGQSQAVAIQEAVRIGREILPEGYTLHLEGGAEAFASSFKGLLLSLGLALVLAYMVLGSQFNSFLHPLSILIAVVPGVLGALIGLHIMGQSLNLFSGIGMILLVGIVTKNSIMLVEFINRIRLDEGLGIDQAIMEAGRVRLRPILMTTVATVVAAIPVFLGWGAGAETRSPMATTVIFGMILSTVVTLFVTPALYKLLSPLEKARPGGEDYDFEAMSLQSGHNSPTS
ncbi:MAG: efflux RND transporter permease subunit [Candidatus Methylacidiphilales bacterium]